MERRCCSFSLIPLMSTCRSPLATSLCDWRTDYARDCTNSYMDLV